MDPQAILKPDPLPLQNLLAAAWVLQCQQEQHLFDSAEAHHTPSAEFNEVTERYPEPVLSAALPNQDPYLDLSDRTSSFVHTAPAVVLAQEIADPQLQDHQAQDHQVPDHTESQPDPESFLHDIPRNRRPSRLRAAIWVVEPILAMLIITAFLLTEARDHTTVHAAEAKTIPQPTQPAAEPAVVATPINLSETIPSAPAPSQPVELPVSVSTKIPPPPATPLQSGHKRVTDPATTVALHDLSRYEIRALRRQADQGDSAAAFTLGMAYESGTFVKQNCAKAAALVATSAKEGNVAARYNLGLRYQFGDGIPADRAAARKWLKLAADRGYPNGVSPLHPVDGAGQNLASRPSVEPRPVANQHRSRRHRAKKRNRRVRPGTEQAAVRSAPEISR